MRLFLYAFIFALGGLSLATMATSETLNTGIHCDQSKDVSEV